jgi:hypothetical protein
LRQSIFDNPSQSKKRRHLLPQRGKRCRQICANLRNLRIKKVYIIADDYQWMTDYETEATSLLEALTKRNLLSHIYDQKMAVEAERLIKTVFVPTFRSLYDKLQRKRAL